MICIEPKEMEDYFENAMASTTLGPFNREEVRQMVSAYLERHGQAQYGVQGVY